VIVRLSDFKSNEYAALMGGRDFEPHEENPMIGFRGAARYIHPAYAEGFALECRALERVRGQMGLVNLKVMVPFCRRLDEARRVLAAMAEHGLARGANGLQVYVMCEIPNNVLLIDEFSELFDGFSIGSNDLTQLTLGVDRDSAIVADSFDERDPGMRKMLRLAVEGARRNGRHCGICGQAPSDHVEVAKELVELGIDSISLTPDTVLRTIRAVSISCPARLTVPARALWFMPATPVVMRSGTRSSARAAPPGESESEPGGVAKIGAVTSRLPQPGPPVPHTIVNLGEPTMPLVSMRQLLDHAAENSYGIPAFNVNNLEQVQAVMSAAQEVGAPVILQASAGARKYAGEPFIKHLIQAALEAYPSVPLVMHQDHGQSPDVCKGAIGLGFSSVMMDGSLQADGKTIASYDYNVDVTRKVVDMAHALGVTVEGELGCLGSLETMKGDKEDGHGTEATMTIDQLLTDPEQAADFVKRTQLDALAIAIGTSHGAYKFTRKPTGDILAISRIKEIHRRIPNTHLVMHGSSSVPQDLLAEIRQYGGAMKETYGVPVEEIQEAIKHGVRKINIDTDIRLAMTGAIRKYMAQNPDKFDPRDYLKPAREAAKVICKQRYQQFGCEGQAAKIKARTLAEVAHDYTSGKLAQTVV
jgi:fructose-bisphosphate aldolase, class II